MSEKGLGWWYPAGADNADAPWNEKEHSAKCPCHEDQPQAYECGGIDEHLCGLIHRLINGCEIVEPDCICADLAEKAEGDAAEAKLEARQEQHWREQGEDS